MKVILLGATDISKRRKDFIRSQLAAGVQAARPRQMPLSNDASLLLT